MVSGEAILFVSLVIVGTIAFGLFFIHQKEFFLEKYMPHCVSMSTGVLLSLTFTEFMPHSFEQQRESTSLLIIMGLFCVILAEKYIASYLSFKKLQPCSHQHQLIPHHATCSSIGCIIVCAFFDGFEIPAGFGIDRKTGLLISSGMILHTIPEGVLVASIGLGGGLSKKAAQIGVILVGVSILMGATLSFIISETRLLTLTLPLATGVLLYVSIAHLLPITLQLRNGWIGLIFGMMVTFLLHHS